ncbi:fimbrial biogenesis chaperone [Photorhabdus viridis]|uniref:fimbrial biogenesis chaperone n=1 Tax=Photorhabdus viridis TaxID=3163327 RepID=UPI003306C2D6
MNIKTVNIKAWVMGLLGLWAMMALPAHAGLMLGQTRLVYHQSDKVQSISLQNSGDGAYLIQAAVTSWDDIKTRSSAFTVLPPLFRLEGNSANVMRVIRTGGDFPADRESLFRLRINAIPAGVAPRESDGQQDKVDASLSISLGMNIKFIYRPDNLPMTPKQAYSRLTFTRTSNTVVVVNPTPYYQTFSWLNLAGESINLNKAPSMLAPFGQVTYSLTGLAGKAADKVTWAMMTDFGGESKPQNGVLQSH